MTVTACPLLASLPYRDFNLKNKINRLQEYKTMNNLVSMVLKKYIKTMSRMAIGEITICIYSLKCLVMISNSSIHLSSVRYIEITELQSFHAYINTVK